MVSRYSGLCRISVAEQTPLLDRPRGKMHMKKQSRYPMLPNTEEANSQQQKWKRYPPSIEQQ